MSANHTSPWGHSNNTHILLFPSLVLLGYAAATSKPLPFWDSPRVVMLRQKSVHIPLLQMSTVKEPLEGGILTLPQLPMRATLGEWPHAQCWHPDFQAGAAGSPRLATSFIKVIPSLLLSPSLLPKIHFIYSQSQTNSNRWPCQSQATYPSGAQAGLSSVQTRGISSEREGCSKVLTLDESGRQSLYIYSLF